MNNEANEKPSRKKFKPEELAARGFHKLASEEFRKRAIEKMDDQPSYETRVRDRLLVTLAPQYESAAELVAAVDAIMAQRGKE